MEKKEFYIYINNNNKLKSIQKIIDMMRNFHYNYIIKVLVIYDNKHYLNDL